MERNNLPPKVCILRSNPVKPDSRVEKEALALACAGYSVEIVCWDRDSNHKAVEDFLELGEMRVPIIRIGCKASFGEGLKNIIPYLKFQFFLRAWIRRHKDNIDILHACDFDTAFFTYKLARHKRIKVVFDIFDFLGSDRRTGKQKFLVALQYGIINRSDATIICTEERKKQIFGSKPKRLVVVHNTPTEQQMPKILHNFLQNNEKIKVCYVGILQDGRLLREIGDYFSKHPEIELHIGGFGILEDYFKELSNRYDNIKFYGRIQYANTLELEHNCDIMLAIYDPAISNHRFAAPNKFYESLFLGKPVIMVKNTGMTEVVKDNNIGVLIDYSEEGFKEGIDKLISEKADWASMSERMKKLYKDKYSWTEMEKRLINLYAELSNEKNIDR